MPYDDLFDTIDICHQNVGHKWRDIMAVEVNKRYLNLTGDLVTRNFLYSIFLFSNSIIQLNILINNK